MANYKYPSGLKSKGPMGWLGFMAVGFSPLFFFWLNGYHTETKHGVTNRSVVNEDQVYFSWINGEFKSTIQYRELLDYNPTYDFSGLDQRRLRINKMISSTIDKI